MVRLYRALAELLEAKAELLREEAATIALGTYARGYRDAQDDCTNNFEIVYTDETDED